MNILNVSLLQFGSSNKKEAPVRGEKVPKRYVDLNTCSTVHIGFTPFAIRDLPFLVNNPKRLSSWK